MECENDVDSEHNEELIKMVQLLGALNALQRFCSRG